MPNQAVNAHRSNPKLRISIVIPVFNEGSSLSHLVQDLLKDPSWAEVVLVDASTDRESLALLNKLSCLMAHEPRYSLIKANSTGRAKQMNQGAAACTSEVLLFLHADTRLPTNAASLVLQSMLGTSCWGRFDVQFDINTRAYRLIAFFMNHRSAFTGISTGDQAQFIMRDCFIDIDGFPPQALMEDIEISRRLKKRSRPARIRQTVTTAARRWQQNGLLRTISLMWFFRFSYWLGINPSTLASWYRHVR